MGEAADGVEALATARRVRPEVVLLDIQLAGIDVSPWPSSFPLTRIRPLSF